MNMLLARDTIRAAIVEDILGTPSVGAHLRHILCHGHSGVYSYSDPDLVEECIERGLHESNDCVNEALITMQDVLSLPKVSYLVLIESKHSLPQIFKVCTRINLHVSDADTLNRLCYDLGIGFDPEVDTVQILPANQDVHEVTWGG